MVAKDTLGGFEHEVLLAALHLESDAYASAIVVELESRSHRRVSAAAVYIALRRLEDAGLVRSEMRTSQAIGGRRERRYFTPTEAGFSLLRDTRTRLIRLWDGLEPILAGDNR